MPHLLLGTALSALPGIQYKGVRPLQACAVCKSCGYIGESKYGECRGLRDKFGGERFLLGVEWEGADRRVWGSQRFLEDDDDMMKMCLTRKKLLEHANASVGACSLVFCYCIASDGQAWTGL